MHVVRLGGAVLDALGQVGLLAALAAGAAPVLPRRDAARDAETALALALVRVLRLAAVGRGLAVLLAEVVCGLAGLLVGLALVLRGAPLGLALVLARTPVGTVLVPAGLAVRAELVLARLPVGAELVLAGPPVGLVLIAAGLAVGALLLPAPAGPAAVRAGRGPVRGRAVLRRRVPGTGRLRRGLPPLSPDPVLPPPPRPALLPPEVPPPPLPEPEPVFVPAAPDLPRAEARAACAPSSALRSSLRFSASDVSRSVFAFRSSIFRAIIASRYGASASRFSLAAAIRFSIQSPIRSAKERGSTYSAGSYSSGSNCAS
ncbi:hypothetical protein ACPCVL_28335 [Streptomyces koyangensis]|uniref:hypothetical protein n=1 Tax=Streptomyces koyangensis TaxID=188770 RepID=UPI003C2D393A